MNIPHVALRPGAAQALADVSGIARLSLLGLLAHPRPLTSHISSSRKGRDSHRDGEGSCNVTSLERNEILGGVPKTGGRSLTVQPLKGLVLMCVNSHLATNQSCCTCHRAAMLSCPNEAGSAAAKGPRLSAS